VVPNVWYTYHKWYTESSSFVGGIGAAPNVRRNVDGWPVEAYLEDCNIEDVSIPGYK
jgi:hypothetical protein